MTDIGKVLQEARMQKGLTLDDLQQITKIQKRYLIAIESNDFDSLPGEFYVRAFVRQYAEIVDLNADELLASLAPAEPETADVAEPEQTKRTQAQESEQNATKLERIYGYLPTIVIVVIVVGILGTIWAMTFANHNKNANTQIDNSSSKVAVSSDVSSSKSSKKSKSTKAKKKTTKSKQKITYTKTSDSVYYYTLKNGKTKNKVTITASGRAWNAVSADGVQKWQGTLTSGSHTVTLPANTTTIKLQIGNSNYTTVKINGKKFNYKAQSSSSTVRTISITVK